MRRRSNERWWACLIFLTYVLVLLRSAPAIGYSQIEGQHAAATSACRAWLSILRVDLREAVQPEVIEQYWSVSPDQGSFIRGLSALLQIAAETQLGALATSWLEAGTLYRAPAILLNAVGAGLIFVWGSATVNRGSGLVGALSVVFVPAVFHDAHLAEFALPAGTLGLLTLYCYARSLATQSFGWCFSSGLCLALLVNVRQAGWLLIPALLIHAIVSQSQSWFARAGKLSFKLPRVWAHLALLSPAVLLISWPWLWFETGPRLLAALRLDASGPGAVDAAFTPSTLQVAFTTFPATTLLLCAIGLISALFASLRAWERSDGSALDEPSLTSRSSTELLWGLGLLINYVPASSTTDWAGSAQWLAAYPYIGLFIARGFDTVCRNFTDVPRSEVPLPGLGLALGRVAVGVSVLAGPLVMTSHSHPFGRAFHTPLVGGASGAANLSLQRPFSGYAYRPLMGLMNERARVDARIYTPKPAENGFNLLRHDGQFRRDIEPAATIEASDLAAYYDLPNERWKEYRVWLDYSTVSPSEVVAYDGVPIVWVYERR